MFQALQRPLVTIGSASINSTELLGFITGAACVWMVARQNIWNWPLGILNNLFFLLLFWTTGLYADSGLQIVYITLAIYGWWLWLHGGQARATLRAITAPNLAIRAKSELLTFNDRWDATRRHEVGISTIASGREIAIAALPGEPLHRLQTRWKQEADAAFPLFYGYTYSAGGVWPGYLPDIRSAANPGHPG